MCWSRGKKCIRLVAVAVPSLLFLNLNISQTSISCPTQTSDNLSHRNSYYLYSTITNHRHGCGGVQAKQKIPTSAAQASRLNPSGSTAAWKLQVSYHHRVNTSISRVSALLQGSVLYLGLPCRRCSSML